MSKFVLSCDPCLRVTRFAASHCKPSRFSEIRSNAFSKNVRGLLLLGHLPNFLITDHHIQKQLFFLYLFPVYLTTLFNNSGYKSSNETINDLRIRKGYGRKRLWPNVDTIPVHAWRG
jgi:hypothetical protein